ncbi:MAG: succinate--CoA ligase subunit alpha [Gammaproteobacteria bacterium]|nr:succinate--CoA ligase subunit alpha [Gammaproteobacteria bacterium]
MSILVDSETRVLCQGITGSQASFYTERAISFGTRMVAGVRPGKGGSTHLGLPVYDDVLTARSDTDANASVIFVPKDRAADAILESIDAEIPLIICITEHIPVLDMARVRERLDGSSSSLLGPNTPGIITPEECRIGIMPRQIFRRGRAGIISRSSTLTYEAIWQTTDAGLGQSTCVGIGGDPLHGLGFVDCLEMFGSDPETELVVLVGEIGGTEEERAAEYLDSREFGKPVLAYIAGEHAPTETRMGHASAIIQSGSGTAATKKAALAAAGVHVVDSPVEIGATAKSLIT